MKEIICYRNNKEVLRVQCAISEKDLCLMLKNKIIFYITKSSQTEFISLDNFDKVVINDNLFREVLKILDKAKE